MLQSTQNIAESGDFEKRVPAGPSFYDTGSRMRSRGGQAVAKGRESPLYARTASNILSTPTMLITRVRL